LYEGRPGEEKEGVLERYPLVLFYGGERGTKGATGAKIAFAWEERKGAKSLGVPAWLESHDEKGGIDIVLIQTEEGGRGKFAPATSERKGRTSFHQLRQKGKGGGGGIVIFLTSGWEGGA